MSKDELNPTLGLKYIKLAALLCQGRQSRTLHAGDRQAIAELLQEQAGLAAAAHADHRKHLAG